MAPRHGTGPTPRAASGGSRTAVAQIGRLRRCGSVSDNDCASTALRFRPRRLCRHVPIPRRTMPEAAALDRDSAMGANSPIVQAAERLVTRIEALVNQVAELKADNAALRREVREAVALIDRAGDAAAPPRAARRAAAPVARHAKSRRRGKGPKGRATPASVTPDIVLAGGGFGDRPGAERSWRPGVGPCRALAGGAGGRRDRGRRGRPAPVPAAGLHAASQLRR